MEHPSNAAPLAAACPLARAHLASGGDGAGSRKRRRADPDDVHPCDHYSTRTINAVAVDDDAATISKSQASEIAAAEVLEDEWKRFARECTKSEEERIMHQIEEEVRREKRKMEATPEWDRAVAQVQQLEDRFHKWTRDEEEAPRR